MSKKQRKQRTYHFKLVLAGTGYDAVEAWQDAVQAFCEDPGSVPDKSEYNWEV